MNLSPTGLAMLKGFESCSLKPYRDAAGFSICYGHFIQPQEHYLMTGTTQAICDELLSMDTEWAQLALGKYVTQSLTQGQFDALVSLVYNIGETQFRKSHLLLYLNQGNLTACANEFGKWIHSNGVVDMDLVKRRATEKALFQGAVSAA